MKINIYLITLLLFCVGLSSQVPQQLSYQAVLRGVDNNLLQDQKVRVRISILQHAIDGNAVYQEEHLSSSNINGLVTLEIGMGTSSQKFENIVWKDGPYFIKSEAAPGEDSKLTIVGVTQILSVPYALHAHSADTIIGKISETDPVFTKSLASEITSADTARWSNPPKETENKEQLTTYEIGDFAQGGIVFWVDTTGQHGLVCALHNVGEDYLGGFGSIWLPKNSKNEFLPVPTSDGIYAGEMNTANIIAANLIANPSIPTAASYCAKYTYPRNVYDNTFDLYYYGETHFYSDYYLPSRFELILLQQRIHIILLALESVGGDEIEREVYLSSTHNDEMYYLGSEIKWAYAWAWYFSTDDGDYIGDGDTPRKDGFQMVRPIRKF